MELMNPPWVPKGSHRSIVFPPPQNVRFGGFGGGGGRRSFDEVKRRFDEQVEEMDDWLVAAQHYKQAMDAGSTRLGRDLQLENLTRVLDRGMKVIIRANGHREIESAIEFAEKWNLDIVIAGASGARKVIDLLAEKSVAVILGPVQRLPSNQDDPYDDPNTLPGLLADAGVEIAFATFGSSERCISGRELITFSVSDRLSANEK